MFPPFNRAKNDSLFVDAVGHNFTMPTRRRNEGFAEWAMRSLMRGVLGLIIALIAAYFVYHVVVWGFAEAARGVGY